MLRPDVLITDWMLENHIHGLSVAEALRVVRPSTKVILMTGYASGDLRNEAQQNKVAAFLEKPFPLAGMRSAVERVSEMPPSPDPSLPIGFFEVGTDGRILYRNEGAEQIIWAGGAEVPQRFLDLFDRHSGNMIEESLRGWIRVMPAHREGQGWQLRGRRYSERDVTVYVLLPEASAPYLMGAPVVSRLLGLPDPFPSGFQYEGHVLIVDDATTVRQITAEVIRQTGGICLSAANHEEAIHLFAHDSKIAYVLLDYEMPDGPPLELLKRIRGLRPHVKVIGCSAGGNRQAFADLGVERYLGKPWQLSDLVKTLAQ
jgi:CheY-like chemotaxis protein